MMTAMPSRAEPLAAVTLATMNGARKDVARPASAYRPKNFPDSLSSTLNARNEREEA